MRNFLRIILYLALVVWLGAEIFFPIVAAVTFNTLTPDTHTAGLIVGTLLRILHVMGMVSGVVAMAVLALGPTFHCYRPRSVLAPMLLLLLMIVGTAYSQYGIIPAMERDRIAAGGVIDAVPPDNPTRVHFDRLHKRSEIVEEAILLLGLVTVGIVAWAETRTLDPLPAKVR
jgi:Domain of unknown function (DUF4149)